MIVVVFLTLYLTIGSTETSVSNGNTITTGGSPFGPVFGILIGLAVLAVSILLFVFMLQDSSPGANRFGPDPKAAERGV